MSENGIDSWSEYREVLDFISKNCPHMKNRLFKGLPIVILARTKKSDNWTQTEESVTCSPDPPYYSPDFVMRTYDTGFQVKKEHDSD